MTKQSEESRKGPSPIIWLALIVGAVAVLGGMIWLTRRAAFAAPDQPIAFSHQLHDDSGLECLFCHPNAMRSDIAGMPSVERCTGCHKTIATEEGEIQILLGFWERGEAIPWQVVNDMDDHVFFSHQPHLLSGLNCETCHGDVKEMTVARPVAVMDMGWCLKCHLDQPEEKVARLADCLACHK
jgi:hypothetical protein